MSSQGKIQYALEKLESAYAPFKDKNGQYHQSSNDSTVNNDCQFKTICFKKTIDSTIQQENFLFCNIENNTSLENGDFNIFPKEIVGIDQLHLQFESQKTDMKKINDQISKMNSLIQELQENNRNFDDKFKFLKLQQLNLNKKLLQLLRKFEVLRCHGSPLQQSEKNFREALQKLLLQFDYPLKTIQEISFNSNVRFQSNKGFETFLNPENLLTFIMALEKQNEGIERLSDTIRNDIRDIKIMKDKLILK